MTEQRKKVPYTKPSKRNLLRDIRTDAARTAKIRAAEKEANSKLRAVVGNPTDKKGKPVAGHVVMTIAANHLVSSPGHGAVDDFGFAVDTFLSKFAYHPGCLVSISLLWEVFLDVLETADANLAREIARGYESAFRWYIAGYVHRIDAEYDHLPNAIVLVEIWQGKKGRRLIAVQRDGKRREIPSDEPPAPPMLLHAGTQVHEFIAAKDRDRMRQIGFARFLAEIKSGKRKFTPRSLKLLHEDSLINVAPPAKSGLLKIQRDLKSFFSLLNKRRSRTTA